jgi:hypothetical protein
MLDISRYGIKTPNPSPVVYAQVGWEDARFGFPFDYDMVDRAPSPIHGMIYEKMRLAVMMLRQRGDRVPEWRQPGNDLPEDVFDCYLKVEQEIG